MGRLSLRARLALAMAGVAVLAVALATILSNQGLGDELDRTSRERLGATASHLAGVAAEVYAQEESWTTQARTELRHLAAADALRATLDPASPRRGLAADAPVNVAGRKVATLRVVPEDPAAFRAADRALHSRLNRLHVIAAALAAVLGAVAAFMLSTAFARPLQRLTRGARLMQQGELGVRVEPDGGPEMQDLARALNRLASTLAREEELRREATADLAHELRTPLTGILSRIEAAQDGVLPDTRSNLHAMHGEALRLRQLLEDLGRLAEAQQPGLLTARVPVDIAQIVRGRLDAQAADFARKGIGLEPDLHPAIADGDAARIGQIVDNLLSNALRYTDEGGTVSVRTGSEGGEAILEVADTGIGIAPTDLPHVFERFWRSDKSRARSSGGAGIGLAIVHELVNAHEGRIDVESHPGRGTTFVVRIPRTGR